MNQHGTAQIRRVVDPQPAFLKPGLMPGFSFWRHDVADYFEPTVAQQSIPQTDMTRLERLLLSRIFNSERDGVACYFFAEDNPTTIVHATRDELMEALASSPNRESTAHRYVTERLAAVGGDAVEIDLDLTGTSGEVVLQDVVKRSQNACLQQRRRRFHLQQDATRRVRRHGRIDHRRCNSGEINQRPHRGVPVRRRTQRRCGRSRPARCA
jgi:hypothetical protein